MVKSEDLIDRIAWLMDRSVKVPGTSITFGLDALIELVPGLGDAVATLIQGALILLIAWQYPNLPKSLLIRMALNVAIDGLVGTIPVAGDVFDVFFKANTRNVRLLRQASHEKAATGRVRSAGHIAFLAGMAALIGAVAAAAGGLAYMAIRAVVAGMR